VWLLAAVTIPVRVGAVELLVETTPVAGSQPTSKLGDAAENVKDAFVRAQGAILEVATSTVDVIQAAAERAAAPTSVEVEFGLKFSAQGNVIVAGAAGEATLKVKLTYERPVQHRDQ
jgi:NTP-dependent ternary system trypsin peptidase co-occuring protein